jgi:hypothetical protein
MIQERAMKLACNAAAMMTLGIVALTGCHAAPQQSLSEVAVPADFTFATSRGVDINLTAAASALPPNRSGELDIARADGKTLFRGQLSAARPFHLRLSVPLADAELIATVEGPSGAKTTIKLPIANGAAVYAFQ